MYKKIYEMKDLMVRMKLLTEIVQGDEKGDFGTFDDIVNGEKIGASYQELGDYEEIGDGENNDTESNDNITKKTSWNVEKTEADHVKKSGKDIFPEGSTFLQHYNDSTHFNFVISELNRIIKGDKNSIIYKGNDTIESLSSNEGGLTVLGAVILVARMLKVASGAQNGTEENYYTDSHQEYIINDKVKNFTFDESFEKMLSLISSNDYKLLRCLIYIIRQATKSDPHKKYSDNINIASFQTKRLLLKEGLLKRYYTFTLGNEKIILSPELDDPLYGNVATKEGIAVSYFQTLLIKYQRNLDKLQKSFKLLDAKMSNENILSISDILAFLLERYVNLAVANDKHGISSIAPDMSRRVFLAETTFNAIDAFVAAKDKDLFKGATLIDFINDDYTIQDWINDCKLEGGKKQLDGNFIKLNEIKYQLEKNGIYLTEDEIAVDKNGEPIKATFGEYVARRLTPNNTFETRTYNALSNWNSNIVWSQQGNRSGSQYIDSDMGQDVKDAIGEKSLDFYSKKIGVILETQGRQHYTSFESMKVKKEDIDFFDSMVLESSVKYDIMKMKSAENGFNSSMDTIVANSIKNIIGGNLQTGIKYKIKRKDIIDKSIEYIKKILIPGVKKWNGISDDFKLKILTEEVETLLQQSNDKQKYYALSKIDFKPGIPWKYLYISERKDVSLQAIESSLSVPFISNFSSSEPYIIYLGSRINEKRNVNKILNDIFWESGDVNSMFCVNGNGKTLNDALKDRIKELKGKK